MKYQVHKIEVRNENIQERLENYLNQWRGYFNNT
mgnify:CR=1 FL=1